jgi:hypothetical protein
MGKDKPDITILIILGLTFFKKMANNVRSFPKFKFSLIPICDSVLFRSVKIKFGHVPGLKKHKVSFRFCSKCDSVIFRGQNKFDLIQILPKM